MRDMAELQSFRLCYVVHPEENPLHLGSQAAKLTICQHPTAFQSRYGGFVLARTNVPNPLCLQCWV